MFKKRKHFCLYSTWLIFFILAEKREKVLSRSKSLVLAQPKTPIKAKRPVAAPAWAAQAACPKERFPEGHRHSKAIRPARQNLYDQEEEEEEEKLQSR